MAYALRIKGNPARVYTILGDGELQEGQPWECFQFISHRKLSNLTILVDHNHRQLDDLLVNICNPFDLKAKFGAFGLSAFVAKGYDVVDVYDKIMQANITEGAGVVILDTVKGIGCSFSEDADFNHFMNFDMEQAEACEREIRARLEKGVVGKEA
jgi:transketolase